MINKIYRSRAQGNAKKYLCVVEEKTTILHVDNITTLREFWVVSKKSGSGESSEEKEVFRKKATGADGQLFPGDEWYLESLEASGEYKIEITAETEIVETHKIHVKSNSAYLDSLYLTYDRAGSRPLALTSVLNDTVVEYSSEDVEWRVDSVFVHAVASVRGDRQHRLEIGDSVFSIVVTAEDGETKKTYSVTVTREAATGLVSVSPAVGVLYADTSVAERVSVYSVSKPAGSISFDLLPRGLVIVKGSSGWVKKDLI